MKRVTIKDIARRVGVSHPTVSKAINGTGWVNEDTKKRILRACEEMNYVPNNAAKQLVQKKTRSIGFIWNEKENLFLYHLCTLLQEEAAKRNIDVFVSMSEPAQALDKFYSYFIGFACCWGFADMQPDEKFITAAKNLGDAFMFVGGASMEGAHKLDIERAQGIEDTVKYLSEQGHRRVAFFGKNSVKKDGYFMGMLSNKMEYNEGYIALLESDYYKSHDEYEKELMEKWSAIWNSPNRPTALICDSQNVAMGFFNVFNKLKISIPDDLSLVVYDDIPELSMYPVGLTTCAPSRHEMVDFILDTFEAWYNGDTNKHETIIRPRLTIRESVKNINGQEENGDVFCR